MRLVFILLTVITIFFSCKKKETIEPSPTNNTNITTNYTYGSMATIFYQYYTANTYAGSDSAVSSFFFTDPLNPSATVVNAGNISYNGTSLTNNSNVYTAYFLNIHQTNSVWAVSGSADVPVINYTLTPNYPVFTGNSQLPDSFSISSGLSFTLTGISNHPNSSIYIQINDNINSVFRNLAVNQTTCSFTAAELSVFQSNTFASITVIMGNGVIQNFNGKNYGFTSSLNHYKSGVLIKP